MDLITLIAIALSLSFDTFAVSLSCGILKTRITFLEAIRIAVIMAIFQGGLPVAGFFMGSAVSGYFLAFDHWIALIVLAFLGGRMIYSGIKDDGKTGEYDITRFRVLIALAIGTSIDAFAVGISLAMIDSAIWQSALIIGAVTFLASMTAIRIGKSNGNYRRSRIEIAGGIILILVGVKIVIEHTLF